MAGAAKGFFDENSAGYRAMQAVEQVYRAWSLAQSVASIAQGWVETSQTVAQAGIKTTADTAAGGAKMFSQLGVWAFPAVAAMVGVMAALGARGGGGVSGYTLPALNSGTGTVLGDPTAESQSIGNSLALTEQFHREDLAQGSAMITALRSIDTQIGAVTTAIARQIGVGGAFDTSRLGLGTTTGGGFLGIGATTRTAELAGSGLDLNSGRLADLINGVTGAAYTLVEMTKSRSGFLGIGGSTTTWTQENRTAMDAALGQELGRLLGTLREGVLTAAGQLGVDGAAATLDALQISLGRIDFTDLSSSEISERLSAVFSAAGDQMAAAILPGLAAYQQAGEGMFETLTRLAVTFTTVDTTLGSLSMTFNGVGLASLDARNRLVEMSGGLEAFTDQAGFFAEHFLTDAQRLAPVQAAVTAELTRLGVATNLSREQFASLVMGLDVSTASGSAMYAALMRLAPALDQVIGYTEDLAQAAADAARAEAERLAGLAQQQRSLDIELMEATGNAAGALAARRADELAALDASLRATQLAIWAAQDLAAANDNAARAEQERVDAINKAYADWVNIMERAQADSMRLVEDARGVLTQAYEREASALEGVIDRFGSFGDSLREFLGTLNEGMDGTLSYGAARGAFNRTLGMARLGNEDALGFLQGASQAFLDAAMNNARDRVSYLRDVALVRAGVTDAIGVADRNKSVAEQQLTALQSQVSGLITINQSVISVADAIARLQAAITVNQGTQFPVLNPDRDWGANPDTNKGLARITGYGGDFGGWASGGGFQGWIVQQDEAIKALARQYLIDQGQAYRIGFATGGDFTVGGYGGVDSTPISFMATPGEMVNIRRPGDVANDNAAVVEELRAVRRELAEMKAAAQQTTVNTGQAARATKGLQDRFDGAFEGGDPLPTVAA
jgi:hypothetical protein